VPLANILTRDPHNQGARDSLKAILEVLREEATFLAGQASTVADEIAEFANLTAADRRTLVGADGKSGLLGYYEERYGKTSAEGERLRKQLEEDLKILQEANDEVNAAATQAMRTAIFGIGRPPIGAIASIIRAGLHTARSREALARAEAAQARIDQLEAQQQANTNMLVALESATREITDLEAKLSEALPAIQKIQGAWAGIADDLDAIIRIIDNNIAAVPPIIMCLGVDAALLAWENVARTADAYRRNAFIQITFGFGDDLHRKRLCQFGLANAA
jgi:DNA repair exonuclease SbcCD ATPase subunit